MIDRQRPRCSSISRPLSHPLSFTGYTVQPMPEKPVKPTEKVQSFGKRISGRVVAIAKEHPRATRWGGYVTTAVVALVFGFGLATWSLICRGTRCPSIEALERYQPRQTSRLYAIDGRFVAELGLERRTLATLDEIPKIVQDAFVVTEDKRFYKHGGIDLMRVPGATWTNLKAGSFVEGFSTITMQLARNIFPSKLTREKSPIRKLKEIKVARRI